MLATERLYWGDDHSLVATAACIAALGDGLAFDRSCFYVGGGGQPPDEGSVEFAGEKPLRVTALRVAEGVVWHVVAEAVSPAWVGRAATLRVDGGRREALSRYHTVLHVLNTIAQRDYGAWITGAQIATDYARIDFQWEAFAPALREEIERKVNTVLTDDRAMHAYWLPEAEFHARPELLRTLEVKPPVIDGRVRVVEIAGFDTQACGGTHVRSTKDLGVFAVTKMENKGRINKRLYVKLSA